MRLKESFALVCVILLAASCARDSGQLAVPEEEAYEERDEYEGKWYAFAVPQTVRIGGDYLDGLSSAAGTPGWSAHTPMPLSREGACIASVGDRIYVTHGFGNTGDSNTTQIYDIATDTWSVGAPANVPRSEGTAAAHAGKVFCIGGRTPGSETSNEIYDPASNTWTAGAPMPTPRSGFSLAAHSGRLFAIGGGTLRSAPRSGIETGLNEIYNIASDSWSVGAPMPTARMDISSVAHGDRIYVVGGWSLRNCGGTCNVLEIYNIAKDTWTQGAPMPTRRSSLAVETKGNTLFAIAGALQSGMLTNVVEAYNINKNTWSPFVAKPTATGETFAVNHGDKVFVIGGGFFGLGSLPVPGSVNESLKPN